MNKVNNTNITPLEYCPSLGEKIGYKELYLKREDLHPLLSHKGRSIPYMIDMAIKNDFRKFAISSSGNAGIASALYIDKLSKLDPSLKDLEIDIFIGMNIDENKRKKLFEIAESNPNIIRVSMHDRPLQALTVKTKSEDVYSLRQSVDENAKQGYMELWKEIEEDLGKVSAIFIGTSSGTTAESISDYKWKQGVPEIHIVQTPSCHPIFDQVKSDVGEQNEISTLSREKSIANAIVDKTALRKDSLSGAVQNSNGGAWVANNEDILTAVDLVKKHASLDISNNSALSISGLAQAVYTGKSDKWTGPVVCIICGE